jgi:hypothetical protein
MSLDNGKAELLLKLDDCTWAAESGSTESTDGSRPITLAPQSRSGPIATATINVYIQ